MDQIPSVYIAGPDVFRPDAKAFYENATKMCHELQLRPLVPFDLTLTEPQAIFEHNCKLLRACHGVVANVNQFRGSEPDSGTCWEMGFAKALDKPVVGYLSDGSEVWDKAYSYFAMREQAGMLYNFSPPVDPHPDYVFPDSMTAETWGYPVNLMLQSGAKKIVEGNLREALLHLRGILHDHW